MNKENFDNDENNERKSIRNYIVLIVQGKVNLASPGFGMSHNDHMRVATRLDPLF